MTISMKFLLPVAMVLAGAAAIAGGFTIVGSPGDARVARLDSRRAEDLRTIVNAIETYYTREKALPASLEEAGRETGWQPSRDPVTGEPYGYRALEGRNYEVCASFERASDTAPSPYADSFQLHAAGRQCFAKMVRDRGR